MVEKGDSHCPFPLFFYQRLIPKAHTAKHQQTLSLLGIPDPCFRNLQSLKATFFHVSDVSYLCSPFSNK